MFINFLDCTISLYTILIHISVTLYLLYPFITRVMLIELDKRGWREFDRSVRIAWKNWKAETRPSRRRAFQHCQPAFPESNTWLETTPMEVGRECETFAQWHEGEHYTSSLA